MGRARRARRIAAAAAFGGGGVAGSGRGLGGAARRPGTARPSCHRKALRRTSSRLGRPLRRRCGRSDQARHGRRLDSRRPGRRPCVPNPGRRDGRRAGRAQRAPGGRVRVRQHRRHLTPPRGTGHPAARAGRRPGRQRPAARRSAAGGRRRDPGRRQRRHPPPHPDRVGAAARRSGPPTAGRRSLGRRRHLPRPRARSSRSAPRCATWRSGGAASSPLPRRSPRSRPGPAPSHSVP